LVFEDSVPGIQSAKAAGMTVIAVPSHVTKSLDFSQADATVDGLEKVTVEWIEALV
jgi:beta-phosphoglucomutase-like phosphatase (HAD superfamily)